MIAICLHTNEMYLPNFVWYSSIFIFYNFFSIFLYILCEIGFSGMKSMNLTTSRASEPSGIISTIARMTY